MSEPSYSVFPNGTSHMRWTGRNCDRCWKSRVNERTGKSRCAIENAIGFAAASDGTLLGDGRLTPAHATKLASRLGWDGNDYLDTDCPEREEKRPKQAARKKRREADTLPLL